MEASGAEPEVKSEVKMSEEHRRDATLLLENSKSFRRVPAGRRRESLEIYCGTWNVGNKAPDVTCATEWLMKARGADVVALGAQEASYVKTKKTIKAKEVSAACGDEKTFASRFKRRGFFGSTKWTRLGIMAGGAFAGGVLTFSPAGALCGTFTGWFTGKKLVQEIKGRIHWFDFLSSSLGDEFEMLQSEMLLQMRLAVFVKKDVASMVRSVKVGTKATGLGNLHGNKGGLLVHVELDNGETIGFVSCHLAAHEKPKFLQARNVMVPEILRWVWRSAQPRVKFALPNVTDVNTTLYDGASEIMSKVSWTRRTVVGMTTEAIENTTGAKLGLKGVRAAQRNQAPDLLDSTTHVFFMGDLNYRIDPGKVIGGEWDTHWSKESDLKPGSTADQPGAGGGIAAARPPAQPGMVEEESDDEGGEASAFVQGRDAVCKAIFNREFQRLAEADQLTRSRKEGRVMHGFAEQPLAFIPTFKRVTVKSSASKGRICSSGAEPMTDTSRPEPGTPAYYNTKRVPSWCDRVLWHSAPGASESCKPVEYGACHEVTTSDHAPVFARFRVRLRSLPEVRALPRANLSLTSLHVTRNFKDGEVLGGSVWVHVFVPHARITIPEPKDLSSAHVDRDESQPKTVGTYSFCADDLPTCILGYDEDEANTEKRNKSRAEVKKLDSDDDEPDSERKLPERLDMSAYASFYAVITVVDSRTGTKLGTCAAPLPGSSTFSVPLSLYSERVGTITGAWTLHGGASNPPKTASLHERLFASRAT